MVMPGTKKIANPFNAYAACGLLLFPGIALAHGSGPGLAGFIGGFIHPLEEPAHLIALIAFSLLIGQQDLKATYPSLTALAIASGVGLLLAGLGWPMNTDVALLACAALTAIAVVFAKPLPRAIYVIASVWTGLGIGIASAPDGPRDSAMIATLLGTGAGVLIWAANGATLVQFLQAQKLPWVRILLRVVASWMAACAMLFLALSVAPKKLTVAPLVSTSASQDLQK